MKLKKSLVLVGIAAWLATVSAIPGTAADTNEIPVPVVKVQPVVPWAFAREGASGVVTVTFVVDEKGMVRNPVVANAVDAELKNSVLQAIAQWKFKPAYKDGTAVPMLVSVPIKFGMR